MRYALLIYTQHESQADLDANVSGRASDDGVIDNWIDYTRALKDTGALLALERLQDVETATSVRLRDGERLLTDGPFVETKEHLIGFYLIDVPNLDAALDWAARMPYIRHGVVEVRPVMPVPHLTQIVQE